MKTVTTTTNVYNFNELNNTAKEVAILHHRDINIEENWWQYVYDDAENIGLKLTIFDIYGYCEGKFIDSLEFTAEKTMLEHGQHCETYKTAANFLADKAKLVAKHSDGIKIDIVKEGNEDIFDDECNDIEFEFKKSILEYYRIMLQKQYEYLTSDESITETILANEYEFTEDGKRF